MEDLKISLITFKEKEISLDFSKIGCHKNLLKLSCNSPDFPSFLY